MAGNVEIFIEHKQHQPQPQHVVIMASSSALTENWMMTGHSKWPWPWPWPWVWQSTEMDLFAISGLPPSRRARALAMGMVTLEHRQRAV
jgi:hypothetical protein